MRRLRQVIPSLNALTPFEAAARLESFTAAATELGVSQAAVSRSIKDLEKALGTSLFIRANRRVQLNQAGQDLCDAVSSSFQRIESAVQSIQSAADSEVVTIGVSLAFAHFRLLPALATFHALYPDIRIRVISDDVWTDSTDRDLDLALRYGSDNFPKHTIIASLPEVVFPVCSPQFAQMRDIDLNVDISSSDLAALPLIEGEQRMTGFFSWSQWFKGLGAEGPTVHPRLVFSNYSDAAYSAMNGDGVALGWGSLLRRPLADGRLVALGQVTVTPPWQHHLLVRNDGITKPSVKVFAEWLTTSMAQIDNP